MDVTEENNVLDSSVDLFDEDEENHPFSSSAQSGISQRGCEVTHFSTNETQSLHSSSYNMMGHNDDQSSLVWSDKVKSGQEGNQHSDDVQSFKRPESSVDTHRQDKESKNTTNDVIMIEDMSDDELVHSALALENSSSSSGAPCDSDQNNVWDHFQDAPLCPPRSASDKKISAENDFDFVCPFCNVQESSLNGLENHIAVVHHEFSSEPSGNESIVSATFPTDTKCISGHSFSPGSGTDDPDEVNARLADEYVDAEYTCPYCDLNLEDAIKLLQHVDKVHTEHLADEARGTFSCPLCAFKCNFEHEMQQHVSMHEHDGTYFGISPAATPGNKGIEVNSSLACPVCGLLLSDPDLLTCHVDSHFSSPSSSGGGQSGSRRSASTSKVSKSRKALEDLQNQRSASASHSPSGSSSSSSGSWNQERGNYKKQQQRGLERAFTNGEISVGEYHDQMSRLSQVGAKDLDDGQTRVQGLVERIGELFRRQARADQRVYLCSPTDHFSGSYGDKGWGCGYRNFQMILSCLMRNPDYTSRIFPRGHPSMPSIPRIQEIIEEAWRSGFDPQGRQQLGGKLVKTRKWIGATEIVATFSSLRVKCQLVDFHFPSASDGTHPRLLQWVADYFSSDRPFKPPIYLQHQGHSRTIVGVEKEKGVNKLLLFDPGYSNMAAIAKVPLTWKQMRTFRRPQAAFQAKQYQIVAVVGLLSDREYQESKVLKSERLS